ncbi:hypothetical protein GUITHDRAFT_100518 [Guillardia theta CCMP2712]|uniref:Uncharacterized protein n=1 Tax=Guillardia theta (strain CCMP2712) TaxID=905079 RepID=L1JYT5_GUITC|nr:hypothetical protein GUITHDRAFT_100518 [Guillardia theta CCMP2712]EKX53532.1 hypothetical protein GUITHDRAFT_100518 [Guillardia theta CCMP2712]|mmetsp:Transcript_47431/g.148390  ORF Transcript_47431/g.148390 Transcript_47431/m.148390 type:complete len:141 (-) Transcript_47431:257-679(-)|eukprot:XP_005840512.1 hypothetical protein GUITHDRAFT_100518 [Guillardia theta CCMP2712]
MGESQKEIKFDEVALNLIRAETIRKERKNARLNETFRLNPKNLVNSMVTGKPNEDLQRFGEASGASHDIMEELDKTIKETRKVPTEKYAAPITSSHEIGWFSTPLMKQRISVGLKSNEITSYAALYTAAMGRNPFAARDK